MKLHLVYWEFKWFSAVQAKLKYWLWYYSPMAWLRCRDYISWHCRWEYPKRYYLRFGSYCRLSSTGLLGTGVCHIVSRWFLKWSIPRSSNLKTADSLDIRYPLNSHRLCRWMDCRHYEDTASMPSEFWSQHTILLAPCCGRECFRGIWNSPTIRQG